VCILEQGSDAMRTFLEKLRGIREDNDLTQAQIAQILGTSQTMYARYERGANLLPLHHLITLCKFYGVSADFILGLDESEENL
jgi:transcriptional regulator with XRE-family HTH domain